MHIVSLATTALQELSPCQFPNVTFQGAKLDAIFLIEGLSQSVTKLVLEGEGRKSRRDL